MVSSFKIGLIFCVLWCTTTTTALERDEPNTKNSAPFDLIVKLGRKNQKLSVEALDSIARSSLGVEDLVDQAKKLIYQKLGEKRGDSSRLDKLSKLPTLPPDFDVKQIGCSLCTIATKGLKNYIRLYDNYTLLEDTIIRACTIVFNRTTKYAVDFCNGIIKLQLPQIYYVIGQLKMTQMNEICPYLNTCFRPKNSKATSSIVEVESLEQRTRILQKANFEVRNKVTDLKPLRVIQLTDIHIEPNYKENSNTDCGLAVCCLEKYGDGTAGYYGDYKCNIPIRTIKNFLAKINEMKPDIILYSGDTPPHTAWEETFDSQLSCTKALTEIIQQYLPNTKVYPCVGNHENYPTNLFSRNYLNYTQKFTTDFFTYWNPIINFSPEQEKNVKYGGYYSVQLRDKLKLIVLNTNYWYVYNWYNILNDLNDLNKPFSKPFETKAMLNFMETELNKAKIAGDKVILMSHHVPGNADYIIKFSHIFEETIIKYNDIITLLPVGHTHYDEFRIMRDENGVAKSVVLVSPSITTKSSRNPSMRIYQLDPDNYELLDYEQHYLDLQAINDAALINNGPTEDITNHIKLLYSARNAYNLIDLSATSWEQLALRFNSDPDLRNRHVSYSTAAGDSSNSYCSERCIENYVCRMRNSNFDDYEACTPPVPSPSTINLTQFNLPDITPPPFPTRKPFRPIANVEDKKEKSTDCDSALIPLHCVHG